MNIKNIQRYTILIDLACELLEMVANILDEPLSPQEEKLEMATILEKLQVALGEK